MEAKYTEQEIAEFEAMIRSRGASFSARLDAIIEHYKKGDAQDEKRSQIHYKPEWIEKILSGQKIMTIRRTQYLCGIYDVVSEAEPDKVVCQIEIVKVRKWETDKRLYFAEDYCKKFDNVLVDFNRCGFDNVDDYIQYHRENYAPVKFAHTFQLMKGDDHA